MKTEIYWFSGTGNSLVAARDIAATTGGELIPMSSVVERESIKTDAEVIGLVFPVYFASLGGSGIPLIVENFVGKLDDPGSKYIFAVCTHRGGPFSTIGNLDKLLKKRGGKLAAGFTVKLSLPFPSGQKLMNAIFGTEIRIDPEKEEAEMKKLAAAWKTKLDEIAECVTGRKPGRLETIGPVAKLVHAPWLAFQYRIGVTRYRHLTGRGDGSFSELVPVSDIGFAVNENCTGCGTCVRVCPVDNIKLVDNRPVWLHHCENCYACFQWCPQQAIGGETPKYEKRYHHPDIKLKDFLG